MTTATLPTTSLTAGARSAIYGMLARAFAYPDAENRAAIAEYAAMLIDERAPIGAEARHVAVAMQTAPDLETWFTRLFTHSFSRDCPTFETAYTSRETFQQAQEMADIAGFYEAFGVQVAPGSDRPDHITGELEFMQFLAAKEAYADAHLGIARVRQSRKAQRLFLQDHLACWGPAFARRVELMDGYGWYGQVAHLLTAWLAEECADLGVTPAVVVDASLPNWPAQDDGECGAQEDMFDDCSGCPASAAETDPTAESGRITEPSRRGIPLPLLG